MYKKKNPQKKPHKKPHKQTNKQKTTTTLMSWCQISEFYGF